MQFDKEVLLRSQEIPVLVDFWAQWCGPCQVLGPVLEQLDKEADGKWTLVKVNTEEHPELAQSYNIRGIPAVKLFHKGDVIAEFTGALPKFQIEQWLEEYLPDARLDELKQLIQDENMDAIKEFTTAHPDYEEGSYESLKYAVLRDTDLAASLIDRLKQSPKYQTIVLGYEAILQVYNWENTGDAHEKVLEAISAAKSALHENNLDAVLEYLIQSIMLGKDYRDEMARMACLGLFRLLGEQHEITQKHRRRFNMALY